MFMRGLIFLCVMLFLSGCTSVVRVRRGDTLYSLSRKYEVPVRALIQENKIPSPYIIKVGQRLKIPQPKTYTVCHKDTLYSMEEVPQATTGAGKKKSAAKSSPKAPNKKEIKVPVSAQKKRFHYPVKGKVIQNFGATKGGSYNDGINIAAKKGTPILVADKGTVAYAGSDLKGYGNLVLVRHEGGWFTAYAHADKVMVKKGQVLKTGQKIATVGKSGGVKTPQLHFEVRYKTKPVNPLTYLK